MKQYVDVAGGISGGHLNPSVTIVIPTALLPTPFDLSLMLPSLSQSLAIFRGFPWRMVPRYILAQVLGAFCGALIIYAK